MSQKTKNARAIFSNGFNCAQAVLGAFAPELGLGEIEALRVAGAFGAGMGRMGKLCGAVAGAFMTIGLVWSRTKPSEEELREEGYRLVREFSRRFSDRHGSIDCRALIGVDLSTEAGMKEARETGLFVTKCAPYVADAVHILEEILLP